MYYKTILSTEIGEYLEKNVALIGKVIDIYNERKYIRIKCLDAKGYFEVILYEPLNIDKFSTVIVLGKVREFQGGKYVYAKRIIRLENVKDEIFWRKLFVRELYKRIKKSKRVEKKTKVEGKVEEEEFVEKELIGIKDIRMEILKFIRDTDKGDGVSFDEIREFFDMDSEKLKKYIEDLLAAGEIYEVSPNKYKTI